MKNKIEDLRNHLFATIEALMDDENPMDINRAKAISGTAKQIIDSAKVEVAFLKVTGAFEGSGFIPSEPRKALPPGVPESMKGKM